MGKTAKDVMNKAISYLNTKESPANSNNVIFNTHYYGKAVKGSAYPWCCSYIWDIFRLAGASSLFYDGKKTAYCPTVESWGKANKLTVDKSKGQYGDIVLFDFYGKGVSCHIGLIVQKNSNGTYKTIEGNTAIGNDANGGCVMYRTRSQSSIRCIIRPKYMSSSTSTSSTSSSNSSNISSSISSNEFIKKGLVYAKTFTGIDDSKNINKAKGRVLQHALNLDYGKSIKEDGVVGQMTKSKLGSHYIAKNEKQYMVTAAEILMYLNGFNSNGVEYPGIYGNGLVNAVKAKFKTSGTSINANGFLLLVK